MTRVLIAVEDPGAANFVRQIPEALLAQNIDCELIATGPAAKYLSDRDVPFTLWQDQSIDNLLKTEVLVVGSSDNRQSPIHALVTQAQANTIKTIGVVDMRMNADKRFCGDSIEPLRYAPQYLLVPDKETQSEFIKLGKEADCVIPLGHPHYDFVRNKAKAIRQNQKASADRTIVFIAEPVIRLDPSLSHKSDQYTLSGTTGSTNRTDIVLQELIYAIKSQQIKAKLIVRLHPKNNPEEFTPYMEDIELLSTGGDPLELVCQADLVVGMTSMLMIEAYLAGATTLSIVPTAIERDWLPTVTSGLTPCLSKRAEIEQYLQDWQNNKSQHRATGNEASFAPGALTRVVAFIVKQLGDS